MNACVRAGRSLVAVEGRPTLVPARPARGGGRRVAVAAIGRVAIAVEVEAPAGAEGCARRVSAPAAGRAQRPDRIGRLADRPACAAIGDADRRLAAVGLIAIAVEVPGCTRRMCIRRCWPSRPPRDVLRAAENPAAAAVREADRCLAPAARVAVAVEVALIALGLAAAPLTVARRRQCVGRRARDSALRRPAGPRAATHFAHRTGSGGAADAIDAVAAGALGCRCAGAAECFGRRANARDAVGGRRGALRVARAGRRLRRSGLGFERRLLTRSLGLRDSLVGHRVARRSAVPRQRGPHGARGHAGHGHEKRRHRYRSPSRQPRRHRTVRCLAFFGPHCTLLGVPAFAAMAASSASSATASRGKSSRNRRPPANSCVT